MGDREKPGVYVHGHVDLTPQRNHLGQGVFVEIEG